VLFLADIFPGGGSPVADLVAVVLALVVFALLFWAIDLIDRI
jgi:preprotein translocase subunit SecE